jgi:hypothetical protein
LVSGGFVKDYFYKAANYLAQHQKKKRETPFREVSR